MNKYIDDQIIDFMNSVGRYLFLEYDYRYFQTWRDKEFLNGTIYNFIAGYYFGGNNIPDTAHDLVELIKIKKNYND